MPGPCAWAWACWRVRPRWCCEVFVVRPAWRAVRGGACKIRGVSGLLGFHSEESRTYRPLLDTYCVMDGVFERRRIKFSVSMCNFLQPVGDSMLPCPCQSSFCDSTCRFHCLMDFCPRTAVAYLDSHEEFPIHLDFEILPIFVNVGQYRYSNSRNGSSTAVTNTLSVE
jgi:hypothetical protein